MALIKMIFAIVALASESNTGKNEMKWERNLSINE